MGDKEDYLTSYRVFFETFAATVNPEDQLPVNIAGYTITESELSGEVLYWTTQYLTEKQCPRTLLTPLRRIILDEVRVAAKKYPNEFGFRSDDSVYIALRLMQAVTARVNSVCLRYLDNSRLDSLPPPPPLAQRDLKTVSCATKNSRRVMEDRHTEIGNLEALFNIETTEPTSFYAVYDGHAGSAAATYCAAHLHQYLVESPHFTTDLRKAMKDAFLRTDAEFIRKSNQERACGGSTAVCVCTRGRRLLAAWAGDSLALLAKRMRLMQLVRPHKPSREDEKDRIESSGGSVIFWGTWRVNGQLAVSRAIGDAQYKPYVTARPEIATVDLDGDEDFVVVACDGLWDFVSEDDVALAVYKQLAADPDDLKAVTKRLILQAKRQGSADNISIIVVFLKDTRDIAADNPPMDLGLDDALANVPPFAGDSEPCNRQAEAAALVAEGDADTGDNGVDNSDSDSEDLGPETAVDADDIDAERNHEPAPPTPPAHTVEAGHVDEALVDNVAESGDESEDEWNYFNGQSERDNNATEEPDELPRSDTPGHDNSAWETSSVDMNSSPLNPDAPVFIPGTVAGSDVLLAESPRKPLPMDDIELPDSAQFQTEAVVRPAELLDLDNCDQLNGHHNISISDVMSEPLNGNDKCTMDSLGFGFNVDIESDKVKDSGLIQDFERIQKDTTDFCNIQVFQTHSETNPFAVEGNDELFERLKNKERDPMSMSFYQEKDDDTCERLLGNNTDVDLNAVQPLPDSDDEELQTNGICDNDKENMSPERHTDMFATGDGIEPNNDIMRFEEKTDSIHHSADFGNGDNCMEYLVSSSNNMSYPNIELESANIPQDTVLQTDTPESHKLLFEQIPEIPDGKSSELGFTNDDNQDPSESERDPRASTPQDETSQDIEMESKLEDSPLEELQPELMHSEQVEFDKVISPEPALLDEKDLEQVLDFAPGEEIQQAVSLEQLAMSPGPIDEKTEEAVTPEPTHTDIPVDVHQSAGDEIQQSTGLIHESVDGDSAHGVPEIEFETDISRAKSPAGALSPLLTDAVATSPLPADSPVPGVTDAASPLPHAQSPLLSEVAAASPVSALSPVPSDSPLPTPSMEPSAAQSDSPPPAHSPLPSEAVIPSPLPSESPAPLETDAPTASPAPSASLTPQECLNVETFQPSESILPRNSPLPADSVPRDSPLPEDIDRDFPVPADVLLPRGSPLPAESPLPREESAPVLSPLPVESLEPMEATTLLSTDEHIAVEEGKEAASPSPLPADVPLPRDSPAPPVSPAPTRELTPEQTERPVDVDHERPACLTEAALVEVVPAVEPPSECAEGMPLTAAPAPDLVPEQRLADLITDVDVGVPESRAQEICVPVTSEIRPEDGEQGNAATPPPTPAVDVPALEPLAAAAAVAVGVAAVATAAAKSKATPAKKSPTTPVTKSDARTPKSATKLTATAARTPASATKRPATAAAAPRTPASAPRPPARTSLSAKAAAPAAAKPAASPTTAKTSAPAAKPSPTARVPTARAVPTARPASASTATKPAVPKHAAPSSARAAPAARTAPATRAPAARPAPARAPAAAKPALPSTTASKPASRPAPSASARSAAAPALASKTKKLPEKKPLTNGDVKESKLSPRPAPISRPAPRPAPRSTPAASAPPTATALKSAAARPAAARAPLDKQSKDLANKRITAKAAPPRTAITKAAIGAKNTATKVGPKKVAESPASPPPATNGHDADKAPPSPLAADNALLPDVIA